MLIKFTKPKMFNWLNLVELCAKYREYISKIGLRIILMTFLKPDILYAIYFNIQDSESTNHFYSFHQNELVKNMIYYPKYVLQHLHQL